MYWEFPRKSGWWYIRICWSESSMNPLAWKREIGLNSNSCSPYSPRRCPCTSSSRFQTCSAPLSKKLISRIFAQKSLLSSWPLTLKSPKDASKSDRLFSLSSTDIFTPSSRIVATNPPPSERIAPPDGSVADPKAADRNGRDAGSHVASVADQRGQEQTRRHMGRPDQARHVRQASRRAAGWPWL